MEFEYKVIAFETIGVKSDELTKQINHMADDGWSFDKHTTVMSSKPGPGANSFTHFLTFKRQKS